MQTVPPPTPTPPSSIQIWSLSLAFFTLHLPQFPAVNKTPFPPPSLHWAPVSNHNHIKVQPLARACMCVSKREPERERERTLCCGWTQKPDARVNPSLSSVCLREQRMGSSFCRSLWKCFNSDEWGLPCSIPAVHLHRQISPIYKHTMCWTHFSQVYLTLLVIYIST